jgi:nucleoid-associated protein YgaU
LRARLSLLAVLALASACGCGKPVLRVADASLGDYYTDREFKKLTREQRDEYCGELARQDSMYRAEISETREILAEIVDRRGRLESEADSLTRLADEIEARRAERRPAPPAAAGTASNPGAAEEGSRSAYVVRAGDSLWRISAAAHGYGDGRRWRTIYEANRTAVRDPNLIYPGQELTIPR